MIEFSKNPQKFLLPMEIILNDIPGVEVKESALEKLKHGSPVFKEFLKKSSKAAKVGLPIAILHNKKLIEVARVVNEKDIFAKAEVVLI